MSVGSLFGIASNYIESLFTNAGSSTSSAPATAASGSQDASALSPFAQVLSSLQQLAQANPSQYQQVTQQISANLQSAAQTATANGDTSLAGELTKLSGDFSTASGSGQLPNIQDLAQAIGGGAHPIHHHQWEAEAGNSTSNNGSADTTATSSGSLNQLFQTLSASTSNTLANNSLTPLNIIDTTLTAAGIQGI